MLYAIIADIHGNLAAFEAVLDDIARRGCRGIMVSGGCGRLWARSSSIH